MIQCRVGGLVVIAPLRFDSADFPASTETRKYENSDERASHRFVELTR
jgi:hypothetical protein